MNVRNKINSISARVHRVYDFQAFSCELGAEVIDDSEEAKSHLYAMLWTEAHKQVMDQIRLYEEDKLKEQEEIKQIRLKALEEHKASKVKQIKELPDIEFWRTIEF